MKRPVMPRSRRVSAILIASGALLSCTSSDDDPSARPQPTTTAPSTSTNTTTPEQADEAALRQLAEDWYETSDAIYQAEVDIQSADAYLVDPYLAAYIERAQQVLGAGQISQPDERSRAEVTSVTVDGDIAVVEECVVDADVLVGADGSVINDEVIATRLESDAVRVDGAWRFSDRRTLAERKGSEECPSE